MLGLLYFIYIEQKYQDYFVTGLRLNFYNSFTSSAGNKEILHHRMEQLHPESSDKAESRSLYKELGAPGERNGMPL